MYFDGLYCVSPVTWQPKFLKRRRLALDEQILYEQCRREWEISTNKGLSKCRMVKYTKSTKRHHVKFYTDDGKPMRVSVGNDVAEKKIWILDLIELSERKLIDLDQFMVNVDKTWIDKVCKGQHRSAPCTFWL